MHLVVGKEDDAAIPCALNSTAEILQEGDRDFPASGEDYAYLLTKARIQGRDISKYIPPVLPKVVEKRGKALFTFSRTSTRVPGTSNCGNFADTTKL